MTLVDTSAWVEYLRATGSPTHAAVRVLIDAGRATHTTEVVMMEVLAGARSERHVTQLNELLLACEFVPLEGLSDFEQAVTIYRTCRRAGETVRALNDCLVATVAMRAGLDVLHTDRDFDAIARHTDLELYQPPRAIGGDQGP
ncbi:MAG: PIN domain nuclease [Acidimicrobiia bacterium]|nr:PIN domain nuclease [Acidimicrobiia bacterium]